jgi:hypothetical protein
MNGLTIDLAPAEKELLDQIELDALKLARAGHETVRRNGELASRLMELLTARSAIPDHRTRYFTDPACRINGHGKSWEEGFESNGVRGAAIWQHAHFLKYLRYFVHGPDLPATAIAAFRRKVEQCGQITSGDIDPLCRTARELARTHTLKGDAAAEEFFKLALESGLDPSWARMIRDRVRSVR